MDINTTFQDFINKHDDNNQAPDLDSVIEKIFASCDDENTGNVPISRIISFIEPFLHENTDVLEELKTCLSENDQNSSIDMENFHKSMGMWTEKLSSINSRKDPEMQNITPNMNLEQSIGYIHYGDVSPDYAEASGLNLSAYSNDSHEFCASDRTALENHVQELQHQKNQIYEELSRMRLELNNCNEQNESLQGNLDKLLKKLANEQKLNENLQLERKKDEVLQEELSCANKQIVKLEKSISTFEKHNNQLRRHLDNIQSQKHDLESKIKNMEKKSEETIADIHLLQSEIDLRKQELISEHETNVSLLKKNHELQDVIEECNINIEKLRLEKDTLEKLFREQAERNETLISLNRSGNQLTDSSLQSNPENPDYDPVNLNVKTNDEDEQFYYNFHMMFLNTSNTTNLRDEMTKATIYDVDDKNINDHECDCQTKFDQIEMEKKLINLQSELMQHENCTIIISRQTEEIEIICRENFNYKEQLEHIKESYADLKTQLGLSHDKERLLLDRCKNLKDSLESSTDSLAEIQAKLNEYTNLENKCKALNQKIEELETDNSMKYVKIVNLTVEIEKLRQILAKSDQQNKEDLTRNINQLEQERRQHEKEKDELLEKIKILNEEKTSLQKEKDELLTKIILIQNQTRQLQCEKDELHNEQEKLQAENSNYKSRKDFLKLEMAKIQNENKALQVERDMLKSENNNLESAKHELENSLKLRIQHLQSKMESSEIENMSLLKDICKIKHEKEQLEIDIAEYKDERSFNLQLKDQLEELSSFLEKLQKEHNTITNEYETLKIQANKDKEKVTQLKNDNEQMAKKIIDLENINAELLNKNKAVQIKLTIFREKEDYYHKLNEELTKAKQNLICENKDLLSKVGKNQNSLKKMDIDNKQLGVELVNLKLTLDKVKTNMEMYEQLNDSLSLENNTLQSAVEKYKEECREKNLDVKRLQGICQAHESNLHQLKKDLQESETEKANLINKLINKEELLFQMEKNWEKTQLDMKKIKIHNEDLQRKVAGITKCCEEQKLIEQQLRLSVEDNSKELNEEKDKQKDLTKNIIDLENKLLEEKCLMEKLKEDFETTKTENDRLTKAIAKLESRVAFVDKQNEILDKEKNNLKDISEECEKKLLSCIKSKSELTQKNKKLIQENTELAKKCDKLFEEITSKTDIADQANIRITDLLNDLQKAKRKILENEHHRLGFLNNEIIRNKEENEKIKGENNRLRRDKEIMVEKLKLLEEENLETKQQLEELMMEKEAWLAGKINALKNVDNSIRGQARTGFDRLVKKNMKLDDKIMILEEQLTMEKNKNVEKSKHMAIVIEAEEKLSNEIKDVKKEFDMAIKDNDDLKKEMEGLINTINHLTKENEIFKNVKEGEGSSNDKLNIQEQITKMNYLDNQIITSTKEKHDFEASNLSVDYIERVKDRLCERRLRLGRATLHAINIWKSTFEDNFTSTALKGGLQPECLNRLLEGPLDEEMLQMEYQIHVTTSFLDRLTSFRNHELLEQSVSGQNSRFQESIEQETFSNINAEVLENLGLSGNLVRVNNFSPLEMEEKFTALVLAYTIDRVSLHKRCSIQRNHLREKERALGKEITMLSAQLEKHAKDVDLSPRLEAILRLCTQISISAEQFGSLTQQEKLSKAVELMINYVARLRQNIDTLSSTQCPSIKPPPVKMCTENEELFKEKTADDPVVEPKNLPEPIEVTRKCWIRGTHFIVTLSMAVLIVVILFNAIENCHRTFEFSPVTPPT